MIKLSVITDISVLGFYGYIRNIGKISMDILKKISLKRKLTKILLNSWKYFVKLEKDINKQIYTC